VRVSSIALNGASFNPFTINDERGWTQPQHIIAKEIPGAFPRKSPVADFVVTLQSRARTDRTIHGL
jgi:hypothetical protein